MIRVTDPHPEDVAILLDSDGDRDVKGPVGDLPTADFHTDNVDEDFWTLKVDPRRSDLARAEPGIPGHDRPADPRPAR